MTAEPRGSHIVLLILLQAACVTLTSGIKVEKTRSVAGVAARDMSEVDIQDENDASVSVVINPFEDGPFVQGVTSSPASSVSSSSRNATFTSGGEAGAPRLVEGPKDIVNMVTTMPVLDLMKNLTENMTTEEVTSLMITVFNNDELLERLDEISDTVEANTSDMVHLVTDELEDINASTASGGAEVIVPLVQEFFVGQMDMAVRTATNLRLVADLFMRTMPEQSWEKLGPVAAKVVTRMGAPLVEAYRDLNALKTAPNTMFCQAVSPILKTTSLVEAGYNQRALQAKTMGKMLPSLLSSFLAPTRMPKVQNVTQRFADTFSAAFTSVGDTNTLLVQTIGRIVEHRLDCHWRNVYTNASDVAAAAIAPAVPPQATPTVVAA